MKKYLQLLIAALFLTSTLLGPGFLASAASNGSNQLNSLTSSPLSDGPLMAMALHSGAISLSGPGSPLWSATPFLSCSPQPCVLKNVRASEGGSPVNEDPIAANPANSSQLLTGGNDYNCGSLQGFYTTSNGGSRWTHTCMNTLSGYSGAGDPGVGYTTNGTAYISGIDIGSSSWVIVFEKSLNNGRTWSAPKIAVKPLSGFTETDKDWLQIDTSATSPYKNCLYISVTQFDSSSNSEISVSHSCNGGKSWITKGVEKKNLYPTVSQFSDLATSADGTVYVSWMVCTATGSGYCGGTMARLMVSNSTDGGNTWSKPSLIAKVKLAPDNGCCFYGQLPNTGERVSEIPAMGVDNSGGTYAGNLYAVMYNWTGKFMQVEVATSTTGGASWGTPVKLAPTTDKHDQFFPWLTTSSNGTVGVSWLDRRNDPSNLKYMTYAAFSTNGGVSFSNNTKLASKASNPDNDGFGGGFMGDYTGNTWAGTTFYASWMDTRSGTNCQDYVGGYSS